MSKIVINQEATFVSDSNDIVDTLAELTDTNISSPTDNQILKYDAGTSKWINGASTEVTTLDELSDVSITSVTNGELLVYNSGSGEWENGTIASTITSIDNLGDVTVTAAANGDLLIYNSTSGEWENSNPNYATETYVDTNIATEIANLVDLAPAALDTLNELAAALGDDPNFATTVNNSLATKLEDITGESIWDLSDVSDSLRETGSVLYWNGSSVVAQGNITTNSTRTIIESGTVGDTLMIQPSVVTGGYYPGLTLKSNQPSGGNQTGVIKSFSSSSGYGYTELEFIGNSSGDGTINLKTSDAGTQVNSLVLNKSGAYTPLQYLGVATSSTPGELYVQDTSAHGNTTIGRFAVYGKDSGSLTELYTHIDTVVTDTTAGSEDARVDWYLRDGGNDSLLFRMRGSSSQFRSRYFGVYRASDDNEIFVQNSSASTAGENTGEFSWWGVNSSSSDVKYASIATEQTTVTAGSTYGTMQFKTEDSGSLNTRMELAENRLDLFVPLNLTPYTSGTLPASPATGDIVRVTDENNAPYYYDGTDWLNLYDIDGGSY